MGICASNVGWPRGLGYIRTNGKLKAPIRWRNAAESAASGSVIQKIQKYILSPLPLFSVLSLVFTSDDNERQCSCCSSRRVFRKFRRVSRFRLPPLEAAQCLEIYENFRTKPGERPLFVGRRCISVLKKKKEKKCISVSPCRKCSNKGHVQEDFASYIQFLCCTRISGIVWTLRLKHGCPIF